MDVRFKFDVGSKVKDPFGNDGIISFASIDTSMALSYFIKGAAQSEWYTEKELEGSN